MKVKNKDKVGILIQTFNDGDYLISAVESILNQSHKNITIFILDDGSDKVNQEKYFKFVKSNKKIKYIYTKNNGIIKASQKLLELAKKSKCEYFAKMDADDISHPKRIELQLNYLKKFKLEMVGCNFYRIDKNNNIFEKNNCFFKNKNFYYNKLCVDSLFAHGSLFFKKELIQKNIIKYQTSGKILFPEDYIMYTNLFFKAKIGCIDKYLYYHRYHPKSFSSKYKMKYESGLKIKSKKFFFRNLDYFKKINNNQHKMNVFESIILIKIMFNFRFFEKWFLKKIINGLNLKIILLLFSFYITRKLKKFFI